MINKDMNSIFDSFFKSPESYQLKNASDEQILLYKKAYKMFKENNIDTQATITLDLDTNTIIMTNFSGIDMYRFGYDVAKAEINL